jgi:hypothetical protein
LSRGCVQSAPYCARICDSLSNSVLHSPGKLAELLG